MGKDFPYYALWRLLEPDVLSTVDAFNAYPADARRRHFIRRTKEEMVNFEGKRHLPGPRQRHPELRPVAGRGQRADALRPDDRLHRDTTTTAPASSTARRPGWR